MHAARLDGHTIVVIRREIECVYPLDGWGLARQYVIAVVNRAAKSI
jgi:hypothetical protein